MHNASCPLRLDHDENNKYLHDLLFLVHQPGNAVWNAKELWESNLKRLIKAKDFKDVIY